MRHFDRRVPHICSPHSVRSFITAQSKPAKQHPLPRSDILRDGCPSPIVDYSKYNIELNSMTINKIFPHYFAIAGMNDYIYLHDRRMLPSRLSPSSRNITESLKCVKRFSPSQDGVIRPNKHITACKFSNSNSYEVVFFFFFLLFNSLFFLIIIHSSLEVGLQTIFIYSTLTTLEWSLFNYPLHQVYQNIP